MNPEFNLTIKFFDKGRWFLVNLGQDFIGQSVLRSKFFDGITVDQFVAEVFCRLMCDRDAAATHFS